VDAHVVLVAFLLLVVVIVVVMLVVAVHVGAVGDAVIAAVGAQRCAEVAVLAEPGGADAAGAGAQRAVVQPATRAEFVVVLVMVVIVVVVVVQRRRIDRVTGDAVVVAVAHQAIDVQHEVAGVEAIEPEHAAALVVGAVAAQLGTAAEGAVGQLAGDAAVDHVDCAADGAAAEQQGRRALQHFDLVGEER